MLHGPVRSGPVYFLLLQYAPTDYLGSEEEPSLRPKKKIMTVVVARNVQSFNPPPATVDEGIRIELEIHNEKGDEDSRKPRIKKV